MQLEALVAEPWPDWGLIAAPTPRRALLSGHAAPTSVNTSALARLAVTRCSPWGGTAQIAYAVTVQLPAKPV